MRVDEWRSEMRSKEIAIPEKFPEHLVEALISTIETAPESYPPEEWWKSIRRQAKEIREQEAAKGASHPNWPRGAAQEIAERKPA